MRIFEAEGPRRRLVKGHVGVVASMALLAFVAGPGEGQTIRLNGNDFYYLGAFSVTCAGDACSYNLNDLGSAANGGLWVTDHVYDYAVRRIAIPAALSRSQAFDDLPVAATVEGPWATGGCPGDNTDISGVEGIGTEAASTCRDWYNVTGEYGPVFHRRPGSAIEEIGPQSEPFHPNKFGAYLFTLPSDWATEQGLGSRTLVTGFSREAGANGGSQGPALFAFDPDVPSQAVDLLYYREIYPGCPVGGLCDFPGYESADSWMGADWVRLGGADSIVIAGVKAGSTCYGESADCGDPCVASKGYHGYPYSARVVFYDPDDLAARLSGTIEPYEILPYAEWDPPELWAQECPAVGGVVFDETSGRLYLAERLAGEWGEGIVHVYRVTGPGTVFVDGFEFGNTSAWTAP